MIDSKSEFRRLAAIETLADLTTEVALDHLAVLIDLAGDFKSVDATNLAIRLGAEIVNRTLLPAQRALLEYYLSNAWANVERLTGPANREGWEWEKPSTEKQIVHLRRAIQSDGFDELDSIRQSQVFTNVANLLDTVGRFVEAIEYWNRALAITPEFAMAQGNRGYGLVQYAQMLYDKGHRLVFLRHAYADLCAGISSGANTPGGVDPSARQAFGEHKSRIESTLPLDFLSKGKEMDDVSLGRSNREIEYRSWCLQNCLFLNPLNDLGPHSIAGHDCLTTPTMVAEANVGPQFQGFYNQIKQEYVSARYLYFEGVSATRPHFSDRGVLLYNTLDYPSYSLAAEKTKMAFRTAYSLLDKVAFFLNRYLALGICEEQVSYRSFWYEGQVRKKGLRATFQKYQNWPLRGLFWLSKDLFGRQPEFRECLEPDAQELDSIRNHLEHKYLKIHDELWSAATQESDDKPLDRFRDALAFSLYRSEFAAKALRLLKIARAALVYLSLAIHVEEQRRARSRPKGSEVRFRLDVWKDEWKA